MNIFLLGFMGSGKSSLGRRLANKLGRDFVDLDELIEEKEGKSITEIFSDKGGGASAIEAFFLSRNSTE